MTIRCRDLGEGKRCEAQIRHSWREPAPARRGESKSKEKSKDNGRMDRKAYEEELRKLQVELCHLQQWVKSSGAKVIIVFEGRDAAGKGGTIKAITERVSPRVFRVVALPGSLGTAEIADVHATLHGAFSRRRRDRHLRSQLVQPRRRRARHGLLSTNSNISASWISARSSSNTSSKPASRLIKIWLEVGKEEQERRFAARIDDPLRQWKLSPMDVESYRAGTTIRERAMRC